MTNKLFFIFSLCFILFVSCDGQKEKKKDTEPTQKIQAGQPDYNYTVEAPENWAIHDTVLQGGLRVRLIISPQSLQTEFPSVNIVIASMEGREINDFTTRNMNYLASNMPGVILLERGSIETPIYKGQWFTYTREQNGITRDMINYIIPLNGFAYMITGGTNQGSMIKYKPVFEKIAKSFRGTAVQ